MGRHEPHVATRHLAVPVVDALSARELHLPSLERVLDERQDGPAVDAARFALEQGDCELRTPSVPHPRTFVPALAPVNLFC